MRFEPGDQPDLARSLRLILEIGVLLGLLVGCGGEVTGVRIDTGSDIVSSDDLGQDFVEDEASIPDISPDADTTANPDLPLDSIGFPDEVSLSDGVSDAAEDLSLDWTPLSDTEPEAEAWSQDVWEDVSGDVSGDEVDVAPDETGICVDHDPEPWSRSITGAGGAVVFTEVMYNSADGSNLAWVELYNPFSIDMDISGWRLSGDVTYLFPDDTFMPPGGYLVVASDPDALDLSAGAAALGPWSGMLPPWKGNIELLSNTDRLMDLVSWHAADPWPVIAAGSGASLSKMNPVSRSEEAEGWRGSWAVGGSPGEANFAEDEVPDDDPGLRFSEVSAGGNSFWIELILSSYTSTRHRSNSQIMSSWSVMKFGER